MNFSSDPPQAHEKIPSKPKLTGGNLLFLQFPSLKYRGKRNSGQAYEASVW